MSRQQRRLDLHFQAEETDTKLLELRRRLRNAQDRQKAQDRQNIPPPVNTQVLPSNLTTPPPSPPASPQRLPLSKPRQRQKARLDQRHADNLAMLKCKSTSIWCVENIPSLLPPQVLGPPKTTSKFCLSSCHRLRTWIWFLINGSYSWNIVPRPQAGGLSVDDHGLCLSTSQSQTGGIQHQSRNDQPVKSDLP